MHIHLSFCSFASRLRYKLIKSIFHSNYEFKEFLTSKISIFYFFSEPPLLGNAAPGYTYVPNPDYSQTNGSIAPSIQTPGAPATPTITSPTITSVVAAAAEPWKQTPTPPQSLMKEPPLAANRNTTTQFATQGQQQAAVMMVYGLDAMTSNTDKLFNLVCLYGKLWLNIS